RLLPLLKGGGQVILVGNGGNGGGGRDGRGEHARRRGGAPVVAERPGQQAHDQRVGRTDEGVVALRGDGGAHGEGVRVRAHRRRSRYRRDPLIPHPVRVDF